MGLASSGLKVLSEVDYMVFRISEERQNENQPDNDGAGVGWGGGVHLVVFGGPGEALLAASRDWGGAKTPVWINRQKKKENTKQTKQTNNEPGRLQK